MAERLKVAAGEATVRQGVRSAGAVTVAEKVTFVGTPCCVEKARLP
jgi:hypothetical protein